MGTNYCQIIGHPYCQDLDGAGKCDLCGPGAVLINQACQLCDFPCKTCSPTNKKECLSCFTNFALNAASKSCLVSDGQGPCAQGTF